MKEKSKSIQNKEKIVSLRVAEVFGAEFFACVRRRFKHDWIVAVSAVIVDDFTRSHVVAVPFGGFINGFVKFYFEDSKDSLFLILI